MTCILLLLRLRLPCRVGVGQPPGAAATPLTPVGAPFTSTPSTAAAAASSDRHFSALKLTQPEAPSGGLERIIIFLTFVIGWVTREGRGEGVSMKLLQVGWRA
jgi:hypothetical protein